MYMLGTSMSALVSPVPKTTAKNSTSYESRWSSKETHAPSLQPPSDPLHYIASSLDMQPQAQRPRGHGISKPQERQEASAYDDQIKYRSDENPRPQRKAKKSKLSGLKDKSLPRAEAEGRSFPRDDTRPQQMGGHYEFGRAVDPIYRPPSQIEPIQPQMVIGARSGGQRYPYEEDASRHFPPQPQGSSTSGSQATGGVLSLVDNTREFVDGAIILPFQSH
ncbi:hypothetical protein GALMADRAFT_927553 [Galerina marginata CBS 339.88]|uniref:Uncharacterized protein n=1 Tax=Galerina marginata (strain CBS 339.88) TaxID=685588 RepID=A0A067SR79_GALM3|nr:hypothetical protein GALMADRAFT_927553 [Galerina marginata CBS 339.88]